MNNYSSKLSSPFTVQSQWKKTTIYDIQGHYGVLEVQFDFEKVKSFLTFLIRGILILPSIEVLIKIYSSMQVNDADLLKISDEFISGLKAYETSSQWKLKDEKPLPVY